MIRPLQLTHYAADVMVFDRSRIYRQPELFVYGKPEGLWVSVDGADDWPAWCREESFAVHRLQVAHRVVLEPGANVLHLDDLPGLHAFTARFAEQDDFTRRFPRRAKDPAKWPINWARVADVFDGVIVAPYQRRARPRYDWYYGWDCASGCIWNLDAVAGVAAPGKSSPLVVPPVIPPAGGAAAGAPAPPPCGSTGPLPPLSGEGFRLGEAVGGGPW